jgi:transposase
MPRRIPVPIRQAMFRLWQQGYGTRQLVASFGLPCSTVRRLLRRFRRRGRDGIPPDYRSRSDTLSAPSEMVQTGRPYDRAAEARLWEWSRVPQHLASIVPRGVWIKVARSRSTTKGMTSGVSIEERMST